MNKVDFLILSGICNDDTNFRYTEDKILSLTHRLQGPYKVAQQARRAGYTTQVIDFVQFIPIDVVLNLIDQLVDKDTVFSVSVNHLLFLNKPDELMFRTQYIVDYVKQKYNCKILIGGFNASFWKDFLRADYIMSNKSENDIAPLLDRIRNSGIAKNIVPHYDITTCDFKWHEQDFIQPNETLPLETSRGCIFKCKFCSFENLGKRPGTLIRDMSLVRDELIENYERWGVTRYQLLDDTFNDDMIKVEQWTRMSQSLPFKLEYTAHLRGDLVQRHADSAAMLLESGLRGCHLGVETLDKKASRAISKPWSGTNAREWIPEIQQTIWRDVNITVNLVLGLPYETLKSMHDGFQWAYKNKLGTVFYSYYVSPDITKDTNSHIELNYEKYGIKFTDSGWATDITNSIETERLRDYFNLKIARATAADSWDTNVFIGLGYTREEIMAQPKKTLLDSPLYKQRLEAFIRKYVQSFG